MWPDTSGIIFTILYLNINENNNYLNYNLVLKDLSRIKLLTGYGFFLGAVCEQM